MLSRVLYSDPGNGVLHVGSEPDYPPFCMTDEEGEAAGFSVDLFLAAAQEMGYEVLFSVKPWNILKDELAMGQLDALPLVGRSPVRESIFDFTFPYHTLHGAVFVRKKEGGVRSFEDLYTQTIGTMNGDNAEEYLRRIGVEELLIVFPTFAEAFEALENAEVDAVVAQRLMGLQLLRQLEMESVRALDIPLDGFAQDFSFAVTEGDKELLARLNEGLSIVIANGTYTELHKKWFSPLHISELSLRERLESAIGIIIPVSIVLLLAFVVILRIQLSRQKRNLYRAEEKYRILTEEIDAVIWEFDVSEMKWTYVSPKIREILGYDSAEWKKMKSWEEKIHPEEREEVIGDITQLVSAGGALILECRLEKKDGSYIWVRDSIEIDTGSKASPLLRGYFVDITKEKTAELEVRRQLQEKEIILKDAYHRMKNSFTNIEGMISYQILETEEELVKGAFETVLNQIVSMRMLYEQLLYGNDTININTLEYIGELMKGIANQYSHSFPHINFEMDLNSIEVRQSDLFPIGIIINELVTNLMKHSFDRESSGQVRMISIVDENNSVIIIEDDAEQFDPGDISNNSSGFGMRIINILVMQLGAELQFESTPQKNRRILRIPIITR